MDTEVREQHIKSIIKLEERIAQCRRCPELIRCTSQISLGKGDLQPEVLMVFECEDSQTRNTAWIIGIRNMIKKYFRITQIYHTFLVRCHPKSCISNQDDGYFLTSRLIDRSGICLLNRQPCNGIAIKPSNEEIINCLYFLLEEITILNPKYVILFGNRVKDFILKTYGIFDTDNNNLVYRYENLAFLVAVEAEACQDYEIQKLAFLADNNR